jgi:hypothetical protein
MLKRVELRRILEEDITHGVLSSQKSRGMLRMSGLFLMVVLWRVRLLRRDLRVSVRDSKNMSRMERYFNACNLQGS